MFGDVLFLTMSLIACAIIIVFYVEIRASGLHDKRMTGFSQLCLFVPFWIILSAITSIVGPKIFPVVYSYKVMFLNFIPCLSIWFVLHYIESKLVENKIVRGFLYVLPLVAIAFLASTPFHNLYYLEMPTSYDTISTGPLFVGHMTVSLISLLIAYVMLFIYVIKRFKSQPIILLSGIAAIIPIVFYVAYIFTPFLKHDITALGYFFTIIIFAYTSYYKRIKSINPALLDNTLAKIAKAKPISSGDIREAAVLLTKEGCNALGTSNMSVWVLNTEFKTIQNLAYFNEGVHEQIDEDKVDFNNISFFLNLLETMRVISIPDVKEYLESNGIPNSFSDSLISILGSPIRIGDDLIGVLYTEQNRCNAFPDKRIWTNDEQSFVSSLSDIMAIAISNSERQELMHKLEAKLSDTAEFNKIAFARSPLGLYIFNEKLEVLDCNPEILSLFGVTREYFMENIESISPDYQPDGSLSKFKFVLLKEQALEQGKVTVEWICCRDDGELIPCEITITSVKQKDGHIWLVYVYDLRARNKMIQSLRDTSMQLEEALHKANEASKAKTDFFAKMSHEIRTPMNAIIGMTELALREEDAKAKDEHIFTVKQAGTNLLAIISDILDFSKIEAGKMELIESDYSVSSLLDDMISIIRMRVVDSPIRFAVMADSNIPRMLTGDETRVRQAVLNILSNAAKYTSKGYVILTVDAEPVSEDSIHLIFQIKDSGRGIKQEDIDKLFEEFSRFDVTANSGIEGVGLGLSIAHKIVKLMGGYISVESEYGKGSTFTLVIPQKRKSDEKLAVVSSPEKKGVIVFERRDLYADSITYSLTSMGVENILVKNESELKAALKSNDYKFMFVPYVLFKKVENIIQQHGQGVEVVILAEFGEAIQGKHKYLLSMPVYCMSIADMLNGVSNSFSYAIDGETSVRFTAPDAKVLLVDDIYTNLKVAEGLLAPYKVQVDLCKSGAAALEAVSTKEYDIIFMDHKMPKMDGVEATERIKAMGIKTPVVALTANAVSGMIEMFLEKGFDDFLTKPIDTVRLNTILEKWIPKTKQK